MTTISLSCRTPFVTNILEHTPRRSHYIIKLPSVRGTDCVVDFMAQRLKVPTYRALRHDRSEVVDCHNLASARAIAEGRAPNKDDEPASFTYKATAYQAPSGQFYVMIHTNHRDIRMDVANIGTARYYAKHGVDTGLAGSIYLSSLNQ